MAAASRKNAKTVYLPEDVWKSLEDRAPGESVSAALTKRLRRYEAIVATAKPPVSPTELQWIRATLPSFQADIVPHLYAVPSMLRANGLAAGGARPPGIDPGAIVYRLENGGVFALALLAEALERPKARESGGGTVPTS